MAKIKKANQGGFPMMKLEMLGQFKELLTFTVKHDFFNSGFIPNGRINMRPTNATLKVLGNNNLQYRSVPGGFMLGYSYTPGFTAIKEIKEPIQLSFFLDIDDIKFLNYTNLPFEFEEDKMFYFNNRAIEKDSTEDRNLSLDKYVTSEDKIEICGAVISYMFDDEQYGTEVQVMNALEEVVFEEILPDGAMACDISLLGQPEGKYAIMVDGLEEKTFFLYNGLKNVFGAIDVFVDKEDFGDYAFFESNGDIQKQTYNIRFGARAVRWQYLLIETGAERMHEEHEAYDTTKSKGYKPVKFEDAKEAELTNGKTIHTIWSKDAIPFSEQQTQKFKLKTKKGKSGVESILELPCASALGNLKVNLLDKSEVYSELIVYL